MGELPEIPALLEQDTTCSLTISVAPQWEVISRLTKAEAQFQIGKVDEGLENLRTALIGAELCQLPHQVQRAIRAVQMVDTYAPASEVGDQAKMLFGRLSQHSRYLPSPQ